MMLVAKGSHSGDFTYYYWFMWTFNRAQM